MPSILFAFGPELYELHDIASTTDLHRKLCFLEFLGFLEYSTLNYDCDACSPGVTCKGLTCPSLDLEWPHPLSKHTSLTKCVCVIY